MPKWRFWAGLLSLSGLVVAILGGALATSAATLTSGDQITICHATNSETNPYVVNTPAIDSIVKGEGHDAHNGPVWAPGDKANGITWGDIIPPFDYTGVSGDIYHGHYPGKNWSPYGQAIYANGCVVKVPGAAVGTTVFDAATNAPWSGTEQAGATAYDTAMVSGLAGGPVPTGTVTYTFFNGGGCSGSSSSAGQKTLSGGVAPHSDPTSALAVGSYSFKAHYSGDGAYQGADSGCEPFTVVKTNTETLTMVHDAATHMPSTMIPGGGTAYDTATVSPSSATGTISYMFFMTGNCTGGGAPFGTGSQSFTTPSLAGGSYSFQATYGGDANFNGSTSLCEPFTVSPANTTVATTIFDADSNQPLTTGTIAANGKVYDTATLTPGASNATPSGTVTFTFFHNGTCAPNDDITSNVPVGSHSSTQGPLLPGTYSYQATYSGDAHFNGSTSPCEKLTVLETPKTDTTLTTAIHDNVTNLEVTTLPAGGSVYDLATVHHSGTGTPSGTVNYTFFPNSDCAEGTGTSAGAVGVGGKSTTEGPLTVGFYSFQATYSGDGLFTGSTSSCEPLTVVKAATSVSTVVNDNATGQPLNGALAAGGSVFDMATVNHAGGLTATGTVTYVFFHNGTCAEGNTITETVPVGTKSDTQGPLDPGSYSFRASYNGDGNFNGSTSGCEPFTVSAAAPTTVTTVVFDASTNQPLSGGTVAAGGSVYDMATVNHSGSGTPTGNVTYTFFTNGDCSGSGTSAGTVPVGTKSSTQSSLAAGSYSFRAAFTSTSSGFVGSTSACEPFTVAASGASAPTPTPTGGILAETGANPPGLGLGVGLGFGLMFLGFAAMVAGALLWRRQRA